MKRNSNLLNIAFVNALLLQSSFAGSSGGFLGGLMVISSLFSGSFAAIIGSIALVVGVVSYLVSTSTDLSPVLRLLIKIVFCLSLMVGGTTLISQLVPGLSSSIV